MERTFIVATPDASPELRRTIARYNADSTADFLVPSVISAASMVVGLVLLTRINDSLLIGAVTTSTLLISVSFLAVTLVNTAKNHQVHRAVKKSRTAVRLPLAVLRLIQFFLEQNELGAQEPEFLEWISTHESTFQELQRYAELWTSENTSPLKPRAADNLFCRLERLVKKFNDRGESSTPE